MKQTNKKLKNYSIVAAALTVVPNMSQASVDFTDVNPDVTLTTAGENFAVDLNGDLADDFNVSLWEATVSYGGGYTFYSVGLQNLSAGGYYAANSAGTKYAAALSYGSPISNTAISKWGTDVGTATFYDNIGWYSTGYGAVGPWTNATNKYVGVKFDISGSEHFGWIELSVGPTFKTVTIHGFAYETCAETSINAGQTTGSCIPTSVEDITLEEGVAIYGYDDNIIIKGKGTASIFNLQGQRVHQSILSGNTSITLDKGIYLVRVSASGGDYRGAILSVTKKVYLH